MENKTTTELLNLIQKLEIEGNEAEGDYDWDKYGEVCAELRKRYPFSEILGVKDDNNDFTLEERIEDLEDIMKLFKRHKHDEKSGDVMTRI